MKGKGEKRHDARKSPASAELWRKEKKERNAARGPQRWDDEKKVWYRG